MPNRIGARRQLLSLPIRLAYDDEPANPHAAATPTAARRRFIEGFGDLRSGRRLRQGDPVESTFAEALCAVRRTYTIPERRGGVLEWPQPHRHLVKVEVFTGKIDALFGSCAL